MRTFVRDGLRLATQFIIGRLGKIVAAPIHRRLAAFEAATHDPLSVQQALLRKILATESGTQFGRDHHFDSIRTTADFQRQLPIAGYDYFEPYLARVRKGETNALLSDPRVYMFAL